MKQWRGFYLLLARYRFKATVAFLAILMTSLLGLVLPWALKVVIDEIIAGRDRTLLNLVCAGLFVTFLLKFLLGYVREYLLTFIGEHVIADLRYKVYVHLQRLSVTYFENTPAGRVISGIIGDIDRIRVFLFGGLVDFVYSALDVVFVAVILCLLDIRLAALSFVYIPICALSYLKLSPRLQARHARVREEYAQLTGRLNEVFSGIRIVAGFAKERDEAESFLSKQRKIISASLESHRLGILLWTGAEFLTSLGLLAVLWLGALAVFRGSLTAGELVAFYTYLGMLFFPVVKMSVINPVYQEASASLSRIDAVLREEPLVETGLTPPAPDKLAGDITFEHVSFAYHKGKPVLTDIDFHAEPGECTAIVGKSGAGKSTLISLILRFRDPMSGRVLVDGHDLRDLDLHAYRSRVALVLQDDYLFSGSVRENILYASSGVSQQQMREAARSARAHEFISGLPEGYDTMIGERGVKLSLGQRQRISIARAILRDPEVLILDEATSSVDSETERSIIEEAYSDLVRGRTTFIIAHRFATVVHADRILFLEEGRIVEQGRHEELLKRRGRYYQLWSKQVSLPLRSSNKDGAYALV
ncbi:MAG: ABC transporter ATP-binding protein/permease [Candidatus Omnitrophica bacterium]|nr:ABC transporter ATP-binding protein/permease [Candidatus Omnitrophota bacterium]